MNSDNLIIHDFVHQFKEKKKILSLKLKFNLIYYYF